MAGDEGLENMLASIMTRLAGINRILKNAQDYISSAQNPRKSKQGRRRKAYRRSNSHDLEIVINDFTIEMRGLRGEVASLGRRVESQEANKAESSTAQSRTLLPTERRTRRYDQEHGDQERSRSHEEGDQEQPDQEQPDHEVEVDDQEPSDQEPSDQEPSDQEPSDQEPSDQEPSDHEIGSAVASPNDPKPEGSPVFILERDQLGDRMPETLCNLSKTGFEKASAPWIKEESLDPDIKSLLVPEDDPDVKFNVFEARKDGGMHVYKDSPEEGREFEWPSFDEASEPPTEAQALDDLERFISNPPDKQVPYYNGIMKSTLYDLCPLYPGKTLAGIDPSILTHVNQTYTHLGGKGSATPMHKEDGNLRSANVCFIGAKLWTKIAMTDNDKFENWVRANNPNCKPCPQFVRHLSIFFAPSQLKAAGIAFTTFIQYPGEFIDTRPDQYHQVFNLLTSLAISTNYLAPSETPSFFDEDQPLEVCDECGLKPLFGKAGFHIRLVHSSNDATTISGRKRKAPVLANTSKRRKDWADAVPQESPRTAANLSSIENDASEEAQKQQATLSKMKEHCRSGRFVVPLTLDATVADRVCRLALAIVSRDAVKQFAEAVEHSMRPAEDCKRKPLHELELKAKDGDPEYIPIARRSMQMDATRKRTDFDRITNRYDQLQLAECTKALRDREVKGSVDRLPSKVVTEICRISGSARQALQDSNKQGHKWRRLCQNLPHGAGLLAYLPCCRVDQSPFNITERHYKDLVDDEKSLHRFLGLLDSDYSKSLFAIAEGWYEAMDKGEQFDPDEGGENIDWDKLEENEIVAQLRRLTARRQE